MKSSYILFTWAYLLFICTTSNAQYTKLLDFDGVTYGSYPQGTFISDGTYLYGMNQNGGANNLGTVFKIKPDGTGYVKLLDFDGSTNGSRPVGSLISDGTFLYGMTTTGGLNDLGVVFKIKLDGTGYLKLLDFDMTTNGSIASGSLFFDGTYLYGMNNQGGANTYGTIFKILPDGTGYVKLIDFSYSIGSHPFGNLISDGTWLYGMTWSGGANDMGTVFKVKPDGTGYTILLDFTFLTTGHSPHGSLLFDGTFLYGMTYEGGANNMGTVFKIRPDGTGYATLMDFDGTTRGGFPWGSLISDGTWLYGMTQSGGANNNGTLFKIMPDGSGFVKLFEFDETVSGREPWGSLFYDGIFLYGMTAYGGTNYMGVMFRYGLTTGVNELQASNNPLSVYPNPAEREVTVCLNTKINNAQMEIYNVTGEKIYSAAFNNQKATISCKAFASGIYVARVTNGERIYNGKFIVQQTGRNNQLNKYELG